jgi:hypothetical protein
VVPLYRLSQAPTVSLVECFVVQAYCILLVVCLLDILRKIGNDLLFADQFLAKNICFSNVAKSCLFLDEHHICCHVLGLLVLSVSVSVKYIVKSHYHHHQSSVYTLVFVKFINDVVVCRMTLVLSLQTRELPAYCFQTALA